MGPGTPLPFLLDTLESIQHFAEADHRILLADDSAQGLGARAKTRVPEIDVVVMRDSDAGATHTTFGGFFPMIARAIRYATATYSFQALMRMDTDALMCNRGADRKAIELLHANPRLGMIGSFRTRCDGQPRDFTWTANQVRREARSGAVKSLLRAALANGYEYGEHVLAPGAVVSRAACEAMAAHPLYGHESLRSTALGDDHLHALFLRALGFDLGDFATGDLPLGVWHRNLEWSPQELVARGKCVAHSVRGYGEWDEEQVRAEFRRRRSLTTSA